MREGRLRHRDTNHHGIKAKAIDNYSRESIVHYGLSVFDVSECMKVDAFFLRDLTRP
jgi:hypothetical protein